MHDKRLRKLNTLQSELIEPEFFGNKDADIVVIGWGSTKGLLRELALDNELINKGVSALIFSDIFPLPQKKLLELNKKNKHFISVEHNANGQFAKYIRSETGIYIEDQLLKYDGRQFDIKELKRKILEVLND